MALKLKHYIRNYCCGCTQNSKEGLDSELVLTPQSHSHSQTRITFKNTHSQRKERT